MDQANDTEIDKPIDIDMESYGNDDEKDGSTTLNLHEVWFIQISFVFDS